MVTHTVHQWTPTQLPSGVPIRLTRHRYVGQREGPTVYVQAAQHGREVSGTETLRRLHDRLLSGEVSLAGELVTVPVADPLTFDHRSYTTPEELDSIAPNMNRIWPGDADGTLHERLAAALWDVASEADAIVDLHTASESVLPHVVYTAGDEPSRRLAEAFGTTLHLAEPAGEDADSEWHERSFDGKFRVVAREAGIPCITPELGDSSRIQESAVEIGVGGTLNVLRAVGALRGEPESGDARRCRNHLGRVRAAESGLFRPASGPSLGDEVTEGDDLGTLYDPSTYDRLQDVTANHDGVLYAQTRRGTVTAGGRLASVALPLDEQ
jgi:predicted deacylase